MPSYQNEIDLPGYRVVCTAEAREVGSRRTLKYTIEKVEPPVCACGATYYAKPRVMPITLIDTPAFSLPTRLIVRQRRFTCKACNADQTEMIDDIAAGIDDEGARRRITIRALKYLTEQASKRSFLEIAKELGTSDTNLRYIFLGSYNRFILPEYTPRYLGIDEIMTNLRVKEKSDAHPDRVKAPEPYEYVSRKQKLVILVDLDTGWPIDVLPDGAKQTVAEALRRFEGDPKLRAVAMDGETTYRELVTSILPQAKIVYDAFHVSSHIQGVVDRIFRSETKKKRAALKGSQHPRNKQKTAETYRYFLSLVRTEESLRNKRHRRDLIDFLRNHPRTAAAYCAAVAFKRFKHADLDSFMASEVFEIWVERAERDCGADFEMFKASIVNLIETRRNDVFAYFDLRITNGATEGSHPRTRKVLGQVDVPIEFDTFRAKIHAGKKDPELAERFHCDQCGRKTDRENGAYSQTIFDPVQIAKVIGLDARFYWICDCCAHSNSRIDTDVTLQLVKPSRQALLAEQARRERTLAADERSLRKAKKSGEPPRQLLFDEAPTGEVSGVLSPFYEYADEDSRCNDLMIREGLSPDQREEFDFSGEHYRATKILESIWPKLDVYDVDRAT
jgi:transposase